MPVDITSNIQREVVESGMSVAMFLQRRQDDYLKNRKVSAYRANLTYESLKDPSFSLKTPDDQIQDWLEVSEYFQEFDDPVAISDIEVMDLNKDFTHRRSFTVDIESIKKKFKSYKSASTSQIYTNVVFNNRIWPQWSSCKKLTVKGNASALL